MSPSNSKVGLVTTYLCATPNASYLSWSSGVVGMAKTVTCAGIKYAQTAPSAIAVTIATMADFFWFVCDDIFSLLVYDCSNYNL